MRPVAERFVFGMLAHAQPRLAGLFRCEFMRTELCALVRSVAKWLCLRAPAGAKVVKLSLFKIDFDRRISGYDWLIHCSSLLSTYRTLNYVSEKAYFEKR